MKTSKFSLIGYLVGAVMIIMAVRQYYFLYPDIDKLFSYVLLGVVAIGMAFNYSRGLQEIKNNKEGREENKKELEDKIKKLEEKIKCIDDVMQEAMEK